MIKSIGLFLASFICWSSVYAEMANLNPYYQSVFGEDAFPNTESPESKELAKACAKECKKYVSTKVCFISEELKRQLFYGKNPASCQGADVVKYVATPKEIVTGLTEIAKSCKRVSNLIFHGHGSNESIMMNTEISKNSWSSISNNFSCVLNENVEIDFRSCNIGNGCDGQMQMYQIAKSLLKDRKGTIRAPTALSIGDRFGLAKATSLNGKDRTLAYDGRNQTIKWGYDGLLVTGWKNATNVCLDELEQISERVKFFERKLKKHACADSMYAFNMRQLKSEISEFKSKIKKQPAPYNVLKFLPNSDATLFSYERALEKLGIWSISECLKDNYRKKLKNSSRQDDLDYLNELEAQDNPNYESKPKLDVQKKGATQ